MWGYFMNIMIKWYWLSCAMFVVLFTSLKMAATAVRGRTGEWVAEHKLTAEHMSRRNKDDLSGDVHSEGELGQNMRSSGPSEAPRASSSSVETQASINRSAQSKKIAQENAQHVSPGVSLDWGE